MRSVPYGSCVTKAAKYEGSMAQKAAAQLAAQYHVNVGGYRPINGSAAARSAAAADWPSAGWRRKRGGKNAAAASGGSGKRRRNENGAQAWHETRKNVAAAASMAAAGYRPGSRQHQCRRIKYLYVFSGVAALWRLGSWRSWRHAVALAQWLYQCGSCNQLWRLAWRLHRGAGWRQCAARNPALIWPLWLQRVAAASQLIWPRRAVAWRLAGGAAISRLSYRAVRWQKRRLVSCA